MSNNLSNIDFTREDVGFIVSLLSLRNKQLKSDARKLIEQESNGEISSEMLDNSLNLVHEEQQQVELLHDNIMNQINKQLYK